MFRVWRVDGSSRGTDRRVCRTFDRTGLGRGGGHGGVCFRFVVRVFGGLSIRVLWILVWGFAIAIVRGI